jgi:hypothetical protein
MNTYKKKSMAIREAQFAEMRDRLNNPPRPRIRADIARAEEMNRQIDENERRIYGEKPVPTDDAWREAISQYGRENPLDTRFMKLRLKVIRSWDARDLGPYFFDVKKLVDAPPPIETMHEIYDYNE